METKKIKFPIAGIAFAILVVTNCIQIIKCFPLNETNVLFFIKFIIALISCMVLCVPLFMKKQDVLLLIGTAGLIISNIISLLLVLTQYYIITDLITFLPLILLIFIEAVIILPQLSKYKDVAKKIYFVPTILSILSIIIEVIINIVKYGALIEYWLTSWISSLFFVGGLFTLAKWLVEPYEKEKTVKTKVHKNIKEQEDFTMDNKNFDTVLDYNEAYCELVKHLLLSLFTCGIWTLIWIHKTTKVLNRTPGAEQYDPTKKLLLCLFVPFYMVYWFKKHGERIDKLNAMQNNKTDNATMYLLLGLFIPVVACILMQDNINKLCAPAAAAPQFVAAAPASTEKNNIELLKEYKDLLDMGVITQEEFDAKKQQLLNL